MFNISILQSLSKKHEELMNYISENILSFCSNKDIYDYINKFIVDNNLFKAFPIGISINNIIAHDSYHPKNLIILQNNDIIKIDVGFEQDKNIIDCARSFEYKKDCSNNKTINDCKTIVQIIEDYIKNEIKIHKKILVQNISEITFKTITDFGYTPLQYLGGHRIELGCVHGSLILNTPLSKLPEHCKNFINKNDEIVSNVEGTMFAIEVYICQNNIDGTMIQNVVKPVTHYELKPLNDIKLSKNKNKIYNDVKKETKGLPFEYHILNKYDKHITEYFIDNQIIIKHYPLEWIGVKQENIKYVQHENSYIIMDDELINLNCY